MNESFQDIDSQILIDEYNLISGHDASGMKFACDVARWTKFAAISPMLWTLPFLIIAIIVSLQGPWQLDWYVMILTSAVFLLPTALISLGFWYLQVARHQGMLTIYKDRLEFKRSGLFAKYGYLATEEVDALQIVLQKYPQEIPFTIKAHKVKIRLQLHRVHYKGKLINLPPWKPAYEHPLLRALVAVTNARLEKRDYFWSPPELLEY